MKNKNSKLNIKIPKNKINSSKHKINQKMKLIKTKTIKIGDKIKYINFFKNLNFLVLTNKEYRIYSPKFALIKAYKLKNRIQEIKIIDNENFNCLCNYEQYVNINIKNNKIVKLIDFGRYDINYVKHYKKYIIAISNWNIIFIWENIKKNKCQFITKIELGSADEDILVYEQNDILIQCCYDNLFIYNLKRNKVDLISKDLIFSDAIPFYENNILFLNGGYEGNECYFTSLSIYNIKEKKITKNKNFDIYFNVGEVNATELIKYYKKKDVIILCGGKNSVYNNIYIYDRDFNLIQTLQKAHYGNILGLTFYERGTNDLILSYSEDGDINFYSIN